MDYLDAVKQIKQDALSDFRCKVYDQLYELERRIDRLPEGLRKRLETVLAEIYDIRKV